MAKNQASKPSKSTPPKAPEIKLAPINEEAIKAGAVAIGNALTGLQQAGETFCTTTRDYLLALDFTNPRTAPFAVASLTDALQGKFDDKLAMLKTMVGNADKIVRGGTFKKTVVKGKGVAALRKVLEGQTNTNKMREALAEAKPDGLKPAANAANVKAKQAKETKQADAAKAPSVPKVTTANDAFAAAVSILRTCESFLSAGTDAKTITAIEALVREFEQRKKAA